MYWRGRKSRGQKSSTKVKDSLNPQIIDILNRALASEYAAYLFYAQGTGSIKGDNYKELEELLAWVAHDELLDHAIKLRDRIVVLGGEVRVNASSVEFMSPIPTVSCNRLSPVYGVAAYVTELKTVEMYKSFIEVSKSQFDVVTQNILEDILKDEEVHLHKFKKLAEESIQNTAKYKDSNVNVLHTSLWDVVLVRTEESWKLVGYIENSVFYKLEDIQGDLLDEEVQSIVNMITGIVSAPASDYSEVVNSIGSPFSQVSIPEDITVTNVQGNVLLKSPTEEIIVKEDNLEQVLDSLGSLVKLKESFSELRQLLDSMVEREVNGKKVKVQEFKSGEDANKFLEKNKGFVPVDQEEDGKVYVALESQAEDKV